eukprot:TRINITY_DN92042_c0_g1_i1.p1 TRINITY_DN92042_c0_g1~~TRINITY_DN92042_c0_g1_i1.p1  ORF type:complete len:527 (+),score=107.04 TRINITY_DN92042_c0_g1_i1:60-1583(+)
MARLAKSGTIHFSHTFVLENEKPLDTVYEMGDIKMGEGSFGFCCEGRHKDTKAVRAIKTIPREKVKDPERFKVEVDIQGELDHPHIVKLYEVFQDGLNYYLVMELCTGGELFERIIDATEKHGDFAFGENQAATYMGQILGAMSYLHKHDFAHRDVKPENFLMQDKSPTADIKVIDFGLAKRYKHGDPPMKTRAGTPYYVAPEVLAGAYDEKVDIWSCGVICFILLSGFPPFGGETDAQILKEVKKGFDPKRGFSDDYWRNISDAAKDFIVRMLTKDPSRRPSAEELLNHAWITNKADAPNGTVSQDLGVNLKRFQANSRMKKLALTYIAKQIDTAAIKDLRDTFLKLDTNRDGTLSVEEIKAGIAQAKASATAKGEKIEEHDIDLDAVVKALDTDGSGVVDYTEFLAATLDRQEYMREDTMWAAFRHFDLDGDMKITREELAISLKDNGEDEILKMIRDVDTDADGTISWDEFKAMMGAGSAVASILGEGKKASSRSRTRGALPDI